MTQAVEGFKVQGMSWRVQGVGFRGPGSEAQVVREGDEAEFLRFAARFSCRWTERKQTGSISEKTKTKTSTSSLGLNRMNRLSFEARLSGHVQPRSPPAAKLRRLCHGASGP